LKFNLLVYTWSNRQKEWYNSERRFIFSCKSEGERKKWISAIKLSVASNLLRIKEEEQQYRREHWMQKEIEQVSELSEHQFQSPRARSGSEGYSL
jgi:hypothetical protein